MSRRDFLNAAAMAAVAGTVCGAGDGPGDPAKDKEELAKEKSFLAEAEARKNQPIITWEEGVAATNAFHQQYLLSFDPTRLLGVALLTWDQGPKEKFIEVRYTGEPPKVPIHFSYHSPNEPDPDKLERVRVRTSPRAGYLTSMVKAGEAAKGEQVTGVGGTAGWNIRYNGMNVCISAMHALCYRYNLTPINTPVFLGGAYNAKLRSLQRIDWNPSVFNLWDIAMAEYNNAAYVEGAMRACGSGSQWAYPQKLSVNPTAQFGYKKVGMGSPVCRRGYLNGFGKSATVFNNGKVGYFDGQFLLSSMASEGDSGALLIWENTPNTAAGIIYCADGVETVACPLFRAPIEYVGNYQVPGSTFTIPEYRSVVPLEDLGTSCW